MKCVVFLLVLPCVLSLPAEKSNTGDVEEGVIPAASKSDTNSSANENPEIISSNTADENSTTDTPIDDVTNASNTKDDVEVKTDILSISERTADAATESNPSEDVSPSNLKEKTTDNTDQKNVGSRPEEVESADNEGNKNIFENDASTAANTNNDIPLTDNNVENTFNTDLENQNINVDDREGLVDELNHHSMPISDMIDLKLAQQSDVTTLDENSNGNIRPMESAKSQLENAKEQDLEGVAYIKLTNGQMKTIPFAIKGDGRLVDYSDTTQEMSFDIKSLIGNSLYSSEEMNVNIGGNLDPKYFSMLISIRNYLNDNPNYDQVLLYVEDDVGEMYRISKDKNTNAKDSIVYVGDFDLDSIEEQRVFGENMFNLDEDKIYDAVVPLNYNSDQHYQNSLGLLPFDMSYDTPIPIKSVFIDVPHHGIHGNIPSQQFIPFSDETFEALDSLEDFIPYAEFSTLYQNAFRSPVNLDNFENVAEDVNSPHKFSPQDSQIPSNDYLKSDNIILLPSAGNQATHEEREQIKQNLQDGIGSGNVQLLQNLLDKFSKLTPYSFKLLVIDVDPAKQSGLETKSNNFGKNHLQHFEPQNNPSFKGSDQSKKNTNIDSKFFPSGGFPLKRSSFMSPLKSSQYRYPYYNNYNDKVNPTYNYGGRGNGGGYSNKNSNMFLNRYRNNFKQLFPPKRAYRNNYPNYTPVWNPTNHYA